MFGKMGDMMGMLSQLKEAQKNIEKIKKELDHEFITQINSQESLKVSVSLSGNIQSIDILKVYDNMADLQSDLKVLLNQVLSQARAQYEERLAQSTMDGMPDISGLLGK